MNSLIQERLNFLLDENSFTTLAGSYDGELIGGTGTIDGTIHDNADFLPVWRRGGGEGR